jgi:hypothetical protein
VVSVCACVNPIKIVKLKAISQSAAYSTLQDREEL